MALKVPEAFTPGPLQLTAPLVRGLAVAVNCWVPLPVINSAVLGLTETVTAAGATSVIAAEAMATGVSTVETTTVSEVPEPGAR